MFFPRIRFEYVSKEPKGLLLVRQKLGLLAIRVYIQHFCTGKMSQKPPPAPKESLKAKAPNLSNLPHVVTMGKDNDST